ELHSKTDPAGLVVVIDRYNYQFTEPAPKALVEKGVDHRQDLVAAYGRSSDFYRWSKPIAAIFFQAADNEKETNCTGFLLSPILVLTNFHCISERWQVRSARVLFGLESEPPAPETYEASEIVAFD